MFNTGWYSRYRYKTTRYQYTALLGASLLATLKAAHLRKQNGMRIRKNISYSSLTPGYDLINTRIHIEDGDMGLNGSFMRKTMNIQALLPTGAIASTTSMNLANG
jgi:serine/threonine protein kinase HipA of HipAB toxin-antitoxin module